MIGTQFAFVICFAVVWAVLPLGGRLGLHPLGPRADNEGMATSTTPVPTGSPLFASPAFRVMLAFGVLGTFAFVASTFGPRGTKAAPPGVAPALNAPRPWEKMNFAKPADEGGESIVEAATVRAPLNNSKGWPLLGSLRGRADATSAGGPAGSPVVWIYSSPNGPRYTVVSPAGKVLKEDLSVDELHKAFPDMPVDRMALEPADSQSTKLMHADQPE